MFLRSRLKKELANLRILKNKRILRMIAILFIGCGLYLITEYKLPEDKNISSGTSVVRSNMEKINNYSNVNNYKYNTRFSYSRNTRLKDISFDFMDNIQISNDLYPQGICFTESYILVSSYSTEQNVLGKVMIFSKNSGEYLLSLGMDTKSHLGGIAYDGTNIWVCNSSKLSVERIPYDFICKAVIDYKGKCLDIRNMVEQYPVNLIPSCITYYDNQLWIATHAKYTNSQMISYVFDRTQNQLVFENIYHIPSKVQGIAFDDNGRVLLSTSYGRKSSSYLKIYNSAGEMSKNVEKYIKSIEMPPCSEGIDFDNQRLYVIFESAGKKYLEGTDGNGKSIAPLDKILIIDLI